MLGQGLSWAFFYFDFRNIFMIIDLFPQKWTFTSNFSKTTEPNGLKFTHNIRVVQGLFFRFFCLLHLGSSWLILVHLLSFRFIFVHLGSFRFYCFILVLFSFILFLLSLYRIILLFFFVVFWFI